MSNINHSYINPGIAWDNVLDVTMQAPLDSRSERKSFADIKNPTSWNVGTEANPIYSLYPFAVVTDKQTGDMWKFVNTTVNATTIEDESNWTKIATMADYVGGIQYKGQVATLNDLPSSGQTNGYVYYVRSVQKFYIYNEAVQTNNGFEEYKGKIAENYTSADEATKLAEKKNINGIPFDGTENVDNYFECTTDSATKAKQVSLPDGFEFVKGAELRVCFRYAHTYNGSNAPTLNGKSMVDANDKPLTDWSKDEIITFTYEGEVLVAHIVNNERSILSNFASISISDVVANATSSGADITEAEFNKILAAGENKDCIQFLTYNGVKCAFQVVDYQNTMITLSFICKKMFYVITAQSTNKTISGTSTIVYSIKIDSERDVTVDNVAPDVDLSNYVTSATLNAKIAALENNITGKVVWGTIS